MPKVPDNYALVVDPSVAILNVALSDSDQRNLPKGFVHNSPPVFSGNLDWIEASRLQLQACDFDVGLAYHCASVLEEARRGLGYLSVPEPRDVPTREVRSSRSDVNRAT